MPGLKLYGRTWRIADDDLVYPEILEGTCRAIWFLAILGAAATSYTEIAGCKWHHGIKAYIAGVLFSRFVTMILAFLTAYYSSRGPMRSNELRWPVRYILYARCPLIIFDIIWSAIGIVWIFYDKENCKESLLKSLRMTVWGEWAVLLLFALFLYILTRPSKRKHQETKPQDRCNDCLNKLFRCATQQTTSTTQAALNDVAVLLGTYFSDTGLVFTDVVAGLLLVHDVQHRKQITADGPKPTYAQSWMNLQLAARFAHYAAGSYGWPHFSAAYGPRGLCKLFGQMHCPCCCRNPTHPPGTIIKDNCCFCNTAVMIYMTEPYGPEICYLTLHSAIYEVPFSICVDKETQHIVVTVRGSLTLEDWVTDLSVVGVEYEIITPERTKVKVLGHKGFFEAGKYIAKVLVDEGLLERVFTQYPGYHLVITGQSLGAGVAPPLALFLRETYPAVRCFAFSPPGCVIADADNKYTVTTVCTVVIGDDLVAHMSIRSLTKLRQEIQRAVRHCDFPKYQVLGYGCVECCATKKEVRNEPHGQQMETMLEPKQRQSISLDQVEFCPELNSADLELPGTIMYVTETEYGSNRWLLTWPQANEFDKIVLSKSVIDHHFPFTVAKVLKEAAEQHPDSV